MNQTPDMSLTARAGVSRRRALQALGLAAGGGAVAAVGAGGAAPVAAWQATPVAPPPAPPVPLFFDLAGAPPITFATGDTVQFARATEFPALSGVAVATFTLTPGTTREMHWHNNAGELGWCLDGEGEMVILDASGSPVWFLLRPGTVFFAPRGLPHAFWPTTSTPLQMLLAFDHQQPTTLDFSQLLTDLPAAVIAQTGGVPLAAAPVFPAVARPFAVPLTGGSAGLPAWVSDPGSDRFTTSFNAVAALPNSGPGGAERPIVTSLLPAMTGFAATHLTLEPGATRLPHWHPAVNEACLVLAGGVEVGIIGAPGGTQTATLAAGELGFVPMNLLHYLRNTGDTPATIALFHTGDDPSSVELTQSLAGFPPAVLAASYGLPPDELAALADGPATLIAAAAP